MIVVHIPHRYKPRRDQECEADEGGEAIGSALEGCVLARQKCGKGAYRERAHAEQVDEKDCVHHGCLCVF